MMYLDPLDTAAEMDFWNVQAATISLRFHWAKSYHGRMQVLNGCFYKLRGPFCGCPYNKSPTTWGPWWGPRIFQLFARQILVLLSLVEISAAAHMRSASYWWQAPNPHSYHVPTKTQLHSPSHNQHLV